MISHTQKCSNEHISSQRFCIWETLFCARSSLIKNGLTVKNWLEAVCVRVFYLQQFVTDNSILWCIICGESEKYHSNNRKNSGEKKDELKKIRDEKINSKSGQT